MLKLFITLAIIGSLSAQAIVNAPGCGRRPFRNNKIVGGQISIPGDWGWQVSLNQYNNHFCGGVLISNKHVLTAGHCFANGVLPAGISVTLGVHKRGTPEDWVEKRGVARLWRHENYNGNFVWNDIALLELDKEVQFNDYIIPACLDLNNELDVSNKVAHLTGWGAKSFGGSTTNELWETTMNMFSDDVCKRTHNQLMYRVESNICGGETNGNNGACQGDSGGPLVLENSKGIFYLMGLTSWGPNGCGFGTVYTRVNYYQNWFLSKMQ